jgi:hypothetical protein
MNELKELNWKDTTSCGSYKIEGYKHIDSKNSNVGIILIIEYCWG